MLTILIAEDHPLFRKGTRDVLSECLSPVSIEEAANGMVCQRVRPQVD